MLQAPLKAFSRGYCYRHLAAAFLICLASSAPATELYVDVNSANPMPPYTSWDTAARVIQDAIDVASPGDTVWVTNGVYASGGKVMAGNLTNRVALYKPLTVQSVNGPAVTIIQGAWIPDHKGLLAVRCAWLTNGAVLAGFTLHGGATRTSGDTFTLQSGGAIWCFSAKPIIGNCVIRSNAAASSGGGIYQGTITNCSITGNRAFNGGGAYQATLNNCSLSGNWGDSGGGAYLGVLNNCSVVANSARGSGGGVSQGILTNCTVTGNSATMGGGTQAGTLRNSIVYFNQSGNYSGSVLYSCCTTPKPPGLAAITADPQFLADGLHLASTSPCRAAGANQGNGTDIDGQPWGNPPSIGCDEWQPAPILSRHPSSNLTVGRSP